MSFLERFKGRTHTLKRTEISSLLGSASQNIHMQNNKILKTNIKVNLLKNPQTHTPSQKKQKRKRVKEEEQPSMKASRQNPFEITNPFYLDEEERQKIQKIKRQESQRFRILRDRKRREAFRLKQKEQQQFLGLKQDNTSKWIRLGGIGPNLNDSWRRKKDMHDKMLKFASEIKSFNLQKISAQLSNASSDNYSNFSKNNKTDNVRTRAINYSRTIPKPYIFYLRQPSRLIVEPDDQEKEEYGTEIQKYERRHHYLKQLMRDI